MARPTKRSKRSGKSVAVPKAQLSRRIKQVVNGFAETKYAAGEFTYNTTFVGTVWNVESILGKLTIDQGPASDQRIGNKIFIKKMVINFYIVPSGTMVAAMTDGMTCRVAIVRDKMPNGAAPAAQNIWITDTLLSPVNGAMTSRFNILKDFSHSMVVTSTNGTSPVSAGPPFLGSIVMYPRQTVGYNSGSGTVTDIMTNNYNIMAIADNVNCCVLKYHVQVEFTDV